MAEEELKELRCKLESQEKQFQNYRDECKMLENFLEEESQKKEMQIRQLREEAINREKTVKLLKAENSQLQSEVATLRTDLDTKTQAFDSDSKDKFNAVEDQLTSKSAEIKELTEALDIVQKQLDKSILEKKSLKVELSQLQQKIQNIECQLELSLKQIELKSISLEEMRLKNQELNEKMSKMSKIKEVSEISPKRLKRETSLKQLPLDMERLRNDERLKKYEAKIERMERIIRQLKAKLAESKPVVIYEKTKEETENNNSNQVKIFTTCIIVTKPYFMSPFLEVQEESKTVKLLKSSRLGCFEKSLGSTRHKFDVVSHDQDLILNGIASKITDFEEDYPHFVLIYGPKKTSKRALLSLLISKLLNYLKQKIEECSESDLSATYISKAPEDENSIERIEAFTSEQIISLMQKLTKPVESPKKYEKNIGKKIQKSLITYFCLRIDEFCLEVATSSLTNIPIREKDLISTFYNNVLYSKLPNILQSSYGQKYLILTLNPIVDLYEDCKNTLSVTHHRMLYLQNKNEDNKDIDSPSKTLLSTMARKKLQQYQKQIEQNGLKIRRIEDECFYYKLKFDELEERLKNLLSTHYNQNSYLKKSPILLSYEKMLKFVHSVQAKSMQTFDNGNTGLQLNDLDFEDDPSLDVL